ncbi:cyclopropane-fatty-acyl-phospholipid synthase family protein [Deinococcus sp. MIMF12]|uniref:Cyclopropane-fatty-acyl-phospholipid synthase family protein n=1 Tax=Deinococcus rhizophilus TaxID=3049544 RepID=A0ABT7JJN4_9DEIO|nr:cyclopropane-fatty-acyl-phospholipid synthase family protein [Deinococcus rhizophilus]MDL2345271.1 cyclopropane-fatty-acyl-phospholipid synthase family protein [Deinococcus rhizophilus]
MSPNRQTARPDPSPTTSVQTLGLAAVLTMLGAVVVARTRVRPSEEELLGAAQRVLSAVLPQERSFAVGFWNGEDLPAGVPEPTARLILNSPESLGRMLNLPLDVALGESYLRGDFDIEGDFGAIVGLADTLDPQFTPAQVAGLLRDVALLRRGVSVKPPKPLAQLHGETHSRERDRQAIQAHYDVSNDFYRLWLDSRMVYSCAYFPTGTETLDAAQEAKLELICRKLRLKPGERLLDIGCGWGGLAIYAAQNYGVSVLGVTLSEAQLHGGRARVKAAGLEHLVTLELRDYRDVPAGGQGEFDKIASVGMAEHVGRRKMPEYFAAAYRALKPGGLMLNHAIADGLGQARVPMLIQSGNFARRYVFPDGELLPLWETLKHADAALFEVRDVENLREHYARTTAEWARRLEAREDGALATLGEERYRLWRIYLNACGYYFAHGHLSIFQTLLAKPDERRRVPIPPSRGDIYADGRV